MVECSSLQVRISNKTLTCFGSALRQKYSSDLIRKWTHSAYCDLKMLVQIIHLKHCCGTPSISLFIKPLSLWQVLSPTSVTLIPHWLMVLQYVFNFHIQEEIKSRLKVGNACYYSVQNLLSSSLLSKKLKIKIYRTNIARCFVWVWKLVADIEGGT